MAIPKQRGPLADFLCESLAYDLLITGCGLFAAISHAADMAKPLVIPIAIVGGVAAVAKYTVAYLTKAEKRSIHPLEASLETLYAVLCGDEINGDHNLRVCLHVPDGDHQLKQLTEYVGELSNQRRAGRKFASQSGIIGKVLREREPRVASRKNMDPAAFVDELVRDWSYTVEDAKSLSADKKSWAAVPIPFEKDREVEAIVFCDSTKADFFTEEREKILLSGCVGIAAFVRRRYT